MTGGRIKRINEQLHRDDVIVDAIMDIQIQTSTFHLRLEEALSGIPSVDVKKTLTIPQQATSLVDAMLNGGETEHSRIAEPFKDPALRLRAEEIESLIVKLGKVGEERLGAAGKPGVDSVLERRFEAVFKEVLAKTRELEIILIKESAVNQEKSRRLFLGIMLVWGVIVVVSTAGLRSRERQREHAEAQLRQANAQLFAQAEELTEHREHLTELVEKRTAELTAANELLQAEMAERQQACEALKDREQQIHQLSSRLLLAQEIERKRISMELHDELGQAVNVVKLRLRVIERGLDAGQGLLREECEDLLDFLDQVIEEVRRLSLALSPTILEDLGLTAALRWLAGSFSKLPAMTVSSDIADIDRVLPRPLWITIYRVVQEALTNIGKHAQASHVAVAIQRHDDTVAFSIADDGRGFDPDRALNRDAAEKGLGLATMRERVSMLGGTLEVRSREGNGTRITFDLPIERGAT